VSWQVGSLPSTTSSTVVRSLSTGVTLSNKKKRFNGGRGNEPSVGGERPTAPDFSGVWKTSWAHSPVMNDYQNVYMSLFFQKPNDVKLDCLINKN
jgi:hypothetical protein